MKNKLIGIILVLTLVAICFAGCLQHQTWIDGMLISVSEKEFDIKRVHISEDCSQITINLNLKEWQISRFISYNNENNSFDVSENSFPIHIDDGIEFETTYHFDFQIVFYNDTKIIIENEFSGYFKIIKEEDMVLKVDNIETLDAVAVEIIGIDRAIVTISNIEFIFDVGLSME